MYQRNLVNTLSERLAEPRKFIQIILGPRQVGKTTVVRQVEESSSLPFIYASADDAASRDLNWIEIQWQRARRTAVNGVPCILALDEIQKIPDWSNAIKKLWDADTRQKIAVKVVLLGSTPLFAGRGNEESLAGRFETHYAQHWSYEEMRKGFGCSWDEYLFFGGYPGAASLRKEVNRWRSYMRESIIEATVGRDLLVTTRIAKPALLRQLFFLSCEYAGQILAFNKMLGQLQDAGNTTTLAHYLELLGQSGLVAGIQKDSPAKVLTRGSSPKLLCLDPSLMTAIDDRAFEHWLEDTEDRGRLLESVVGAHLWQAAQRSGAQLRYWTDGKHELDFVYAQGKHILGIEVKSGRRRKAPGLSQYKKLVPKATVLIVGPGGVPFLEFLNSRPEDWMSPKPD